MSICGAKNAALPKTFGIDRLDTDVVVAVQGGASI
jgi:hypothetical protein